MKTPSKKLTLKKETLKSLRGEQLQQVAGGGTSDGCTSRTTSYYQYQYQYQYQYKG